MSDDLDAVLSKLADGVGETEQIEKQMGKRADQLEGSDEQLIDDVAENLAEVRKAAGLPHRDVDDIKAKIQSRRTIG